ncbi:DNA-directed DNA polymerase I [Hyperthermus butylicus]|uniref:DNA-directed DNA polymerase I n=1 Tax=Hyperthermus butylicus TaxID=54248 RepID=UPI000D7306E7
MLESAGSVVQRYFDESLRELLTEIRSSRNEANRAGEGARSEKRLSTSVSDNIADVSNNVVSGSVSAAVEAAERDLIRKPLSGQAVANVESLIHASKVLEKLSILPLVNEPMEAREGFEGFLLQTYYDGDRGVVAVKLYDDRSGRIGVYFDTTGYKPYFLTDIPPDKLQEIPQVVKHKGFDHVEVVEKFDLLRWQKKRVTKIVVKTPDVVKQLRDKVPRAWEANIKFHHNYIYDFGLTPGLRYRVSSGRLELVGGDVSEEAEQFIRKVFSGEDESIVETAIRWFPLFEQPPPKPRRLAVDIEVYTPFKGRVPDASAASYPIISVAFASDDGLRVVFILARPGVVGGEPREGVKEGVHIEIFDDERALILETFRLIANYPIVLTFNGDNFDFPYLYNRALKLGIPKDVIPFKPTRSYMSLKYGIHIDLYQFFSIKAIQSYAFGNAYKEFTLDAIASALLGEHKVEIESTVSDLSLLELVRYNIRDAELTLKLTSFNRDLVWKLIVLLARISRLPIEDVTRSQVSAWIKSLLYWEHRRRGYLIPSRDEIIKLKGEVKSEALIKGKKYQGAIVLDPPSGVFFRVVVLDFASLYPSIIKKWNLSYETVNPVYCPGSKIVEVPDVGHKVCMSNPGLTAQIVGLLRDYRVKIYKKKAKDKSLPEDVRAWYDTVQAAMKVYINASYGVFGASSFPLYAPPVAESVTAIGRYTIKETVKKAAELGLRVLYGDTDSLFIWNPDEEKLEELQKYVEENFGLDLEVDKVYKFVTFSGLKKNYIGAYEDGSVDVKGMVAKKRNTPEFLKKEFSEILNLLGSVNSPEEFVKVRNHIREKLRTVYTGLRELDYNLDELAIRMALNKPLDAYTKNTPQHVKAARQLARMGVQVLPGDVISFVKVKGKEGVKPVQLARLAEVDVDKYVETMKSVFEQFLAAINMSWDEVIGSSRLELFLRKNS